MYCCKAVLLFVVIILVISCQKSPDKHPNTAENGMVVAEEKLAAQVGRDILKSGGNAFDAAVAVGFTLAVTHPEAGNIGGGGFMVAHLASGENIALDFRETAPGKANRDMYLKKDGTVNRDKILYGALAAGVPGTVDGLLKIQQQYGTLDLKAVIQPAIDLAENGIVITKPFANSLKNSDSLLCRFESTKKIFTKNGNPFLTGDILKQLELANTLKLIAEKGRTGFYSGPVADAIVTTMKKYDGIITHKDLENYRSRERTPFVSSYNDYTVVSMPPSSSGGVIISQMLNMMEHLHLQKTDFNTLKYNHFLTECFKRSYADRAEYMGDPDFVKMPLSVLISKEYAKKRFAEIDPEKASATGEVIAGLNEKMGTEKTETTHYNVMDKEGNAVAITYTINGWFGSGLVVEGAGFFLNNEMDDFSAKAGVANMFGLIGNEANAIEPGKRMLSSQSPTVIVKDGEAVMAVGAPGGSRIPSSVTQVILNILSFKMEPQKAVSEPRLHHQWYPDTLYYEKNRFTPEMITQLKQIGHIIKETSGAIGRVEVIYKDPKTGLLHGGLDPRAKKGGIAGY